MDRAPHLSPALLRVAAAALLMGAAGLVGCGGGSSPTAGGCGPITRESLDSGFLVHVLADDDSLTYLSDPPTSGPHKPGPDLDDVLDAPLSRPVQVGALERGDVLVQHDPDLAGADLDALRALAGDGVVVAPNPDLPAPVVATAWLYKRTCEAVDPEALTEFIQSRKDQGPGDDS